MLIGLGFIYILQKYKAFFVFPAFYQSIRIINNRRNILGLYGSYKRQC